MTVKPNVVPMLLDTPVKTSPVVSTTAQSSSIVNIPTVASSSKPIPTPDVAMPGSTTTPIPASTAATPEISIAAAPSAPIVIVRQLKEVRPYDGITSWKSFREHFIRVAKANQWTTKEEQVQHLALALMGSAAEILRGFDASSEKALDDLWGRFRQCQKFSFRSCFRRRLLASGQDKRQTHTWQAANTGVHSTVPARSKSACAA